MGIQTDYADLVSQLHRGRIDMNGVRRAPDKVKREAAKALTAQADELTEARAEIARKDALLAKVSDKLRDVVMGEGMCPDVAVELDAEIEAALKEAK